MATDTKPLPTYHDAIAYIRDHATEHEMAAFHSAFQRRKQILDAERLMTLQPGAKVKITGISPKYLDGLTGVVNTFAISGKHVTVTLDEKSTAILRNAPRNSRFKVPADSTTFDIYGIPVATLNVEND